MAAVVLALTAGGCGGDADREPGEGMTAAGSPSSGGGAAVVPAAQQYVDAVNAGDLDALVEAFTPGGEVVDVNRRIRGRDAIRAWATDEVVGGALRVDGVVSLDDRTQLLRVHWAPPGASGWAAVYTFTVGPDGIAVADLQYAS